MKKLILSILFLTVSTYIMRAQETFEPISAGVISIEARNLSMDGVTLGNILRNEAIKLKRFNVIDRYETMNACESQDVDPNTCLGRTCLVQIGKFLQVSKMISGNVDRYADKLIVTLRVVDVATGEIEYNHIQEFIDIEKNLPDMLSLCLQKMYDIKVDEEKWRKLTDQFDYESKLNQPNVNKLRLSGPRMGFGYVMGQDGDRLMAPRSDGGYDAWPVMSQFGYQFEVSYLNQGNIQALFEFVPTISGLEQGLFIPSVSILHGIRSNVSGLEFAFGPIFVLTQKAEGFELDGQWYLSEERQRFPDENIFIEKRIDNRGEPRLDSGLVLAVGRTFKSGNVNFPVNLVTILKKSGMRIGLSFGFNATEESRK